MAAIQQVSTQEVSDEEAIAETKDSSSQEDQSRKQTQEDQEGQVKHLMRNKLPPRRLAITHQIEHQCAGGDTMSRLVTFGLDKEGQIREVFCASEKTGTDMEDMLTDGCILMSIYLQTGGEVERLVRSLGENRNEGEKIGTPSSILGSIARTILQVQNELNKSGDGA